MIFVIVFVFVITNDLIRLAELMECQFVFVIVFVFVIANDLCHCISLCHHQ